MKTYEELRGMTQEDLVRLVLELQEEIIDLKKEYLWKEKVKMQKKGLNCYKS